MSASIVESFSQSKVLEDTVSLPLRRLRLLRLSVTSLCNFRCRYCMPGEGVPKLAHSELLRLEELVELVKWLSRETTINRVKLTGGEPLVRPGIEWLIEQLSSLPQIEEVSLTTNGTLLPQMAYRLKAAGLSRVNVSLDSLDTAGFADVTRGGNLFCTLRGIECARAAGLTPIKFNAVLRRSTWRDEVPRLLDYAASMDFEIRFIELMRTGTERDWCEKEFVSVDEVCATLGIETQPLGQESGGPARQTLFMWRGKTMTVGWITPRSHPFCQSCARLRMDARGQVRRCLMDPTTLHLPQLLAKGEQHAQQEFRSYMAGKTAPRDMDTSFAMSQIGG